MLAADGEGGMASESHPLECENSTADRLPSASRASSAMHGLFQV